MGAYIINIPDTADRIIYVNVGPDSGRTYISSHRVEDLTPYTEPDLEQVRKEGYQEGYRRALADVREEHVCQTCVYFEQDENEEPCVRCPRNFIDQYTPKPKQEQEEIKVGDEVIYNDRRCVVLVPETPEKYGCVMDAEGERHGFENKDVEKTGRHFPEIATVLEKMKEADNG